MSNRFQIFRYIGVSLVCASVMLLSASSALAAQASLRNVSLAVFTQYDNETGYPTGQRMHLRYTVCGEGERFWNRISIYGSKYGSDTPIRARTFSTYADWHDSYCSNWVFGQSVTSAFKRGRIRACIRVGTTYSYSSKLVCVRANAK